MFQYSPILGHSSIWDLKYTFSLSGISKWIWMNTDHQIFIEKIDIFKLNIWYLLLFYCLIQKP